MMAPGNGDTPVVDQVVVDVGVTADDAVGNLGVELEIDHLFLFGRTGDLQSPLYLDSFKQDFTAGNISVTHRRYISLE